MDIEDETAEAALAGLLRSSVALLEAAHPRLVQASPELEDRATRAAELRRLGLDLAALGEAAAVVLRRSSIGWPY